MSIGRGLLAAAVSVAFAFAAPLRAEDPWTEIRTPHLRVVTNGQAAEAQQVALDFERMRMVLLWRFPGLRADLSGPLTVYAVRDFATHMRLHPSWEDPELFGFYGNWERNIAFVDLWSWSKAKFHPIFMGYAHELLRQNSWPLPVWLDRGYTQVIGTTSFEGKDVVFGAPTDRWPELKSQPLLPLQRVLQDKPLLGFDPGIQVERQQQVNEAWGLVHFLTFASGMKSGGLLLNYYHRLQRGEEPMASFRAEFGEPSQLDAPFGAYIRAKSLGAAVVELPLPDPATFTTRVLAPREALDEEGILRIETRDLARGRSIFERVLHSNSSDPTAHEELGILEYGEGHLAEARSHWQAAVAADPRHAISRFALLMTGVPLREQTTDQRKQTLLALQQVVKLNQLFAPAYVRIAALQWWQGNLDAAVRACEEAERLTPARSDYHLLHAELLMAQHQPQAAAALLRRNLDAQAVENQNNTDVSYTSVRLWQQVPAADRGSVSNREAHVPPGLLVAEGRILQVQCTSGAPFRVTLQPGQAGSADKLLLTSGSHTHISFFDSVWIGGGHHPVCFATPGQPMYAVYKPGSKGYGELVEMELLDDLPPLPQL